MSTFSRHEAMTDLIYLLNTLVDKDGKITICGIYNEVAPLTDKEKEIYSKIHFNIDAYRSDVGCKTLLHKEKKEDLLMHRWRYPSLSLHGIEGAFSEPGQKTVIPRKVIGKFSIRIVPNQTPSLIEKYVVDHIQKTFREYGSPNKMKVRTLLNNFFFNLYIIIIIIIVINYIRCLFYICYIVFLQLLFVYVICFLR